MQGFFKVDRDLLTHELWLADKFTRGQAWVDLIGLANHKGGFIRVRGNLVELKRGDVGWSKVKLSKRWGWSRNKITRFLDELFRYNRIDIKPSNKLCTVISICNYDEYQKVKQQKGQQNEQQTIQQTSNRRNTNKNDKKEKNDKYSKKEFENIVSFWNEKLGKRFRPVKASLGNFRYWLRYYSSDQIKAAILISQFDEYWSKKNPLDPAKLFRQRDSNMQPVDRIAYFLNMPSSNPEVAEIRQALTKKEQNG